MIICLCTINKRNWAHPRSVQWYRAWSPEWRTYMCRYHNSRSMPKTITVFFWTQKKELYLCLKFTNKHSLNIVAAVHTVHTQGSAVEKCGGGGSCTGRQCGPCYKGRPGSRKVLRCSLFNSGYLTETPHSFKTFLVQKRGTPKIDHRYPPAGHVVLILRGSKATWTPYKFPCAVLRTF